MPEKEHVALTRCYFCGEADRILLAMRYYRTKNGMEPVKDLKDLNNKVIDMEPCSKCADWMKQGIILMGIDSAKSEPGWNKKKIPNPHRTGAFSVITEEAFNRVFNGDEIKAFAKKHRYMFIEHEAMEKIGLLPKEEECSGSSEPAPPAPP